ncbi:hypothetical protein GALL_432280 [mine drainage metagenome]|uniref:Uncharacterized protein n=1 Tax=mine drainage metagenome TaxID=410659 RepID=A0A1J5Q550_9ZZZZ
MGRRAGGIELECMHRPALPGLLDHLRRGVVGEVEGHQRGEVAASRQGVEDAPTVIERVLQPHHRRLEVGHDDGPGELPHRPWQRVAQCRAVAQVQMQIVGAGQGEGLDCSHGSAKERRRCHAKATPDKSRAVPFSMRAVNAAGSWPETGSRVRCAARWPRRTARSGSPRPPVLRP